MNSTIFFRRSMLLVFTLVATYSFGQTCTELIKAKWIIDKFEAEKNTPKVIQAKQDLLGVCLTFGNDELTITIKTETGDRLIKKGQYFISGSSITLGTDQASILLLSEKNLTIYIPKQGVLYLTKM